MDKPLKILHESLNKRVMVELRSGRSYHGVLDGYDVSSFTTLTDSTGLKANQTTYLIGNGTQQAGIYGTQIWMGYIFIILCFICMALFIHRAMQGEFFPN